MDKCKCLVSVLEPPSVNINGIPNILSLNIKPWIPLIHAFKVICSDENVLVSTVCCGLLYHNAGAQFTNIKCPE